MTRNEFTTFDINKKLSIPLGRLKEWTKRGFITPSIQKAEGRGTKAIFSREDVFLIRLFEKLLERGFLRESAAKFISLLSKEDIASLHFILFRSDGQEILTFELGAWQKIDVKRGAAEGESYSPEIDQCLDATTWDDLIILNVDKIRAEVNKVLTE